MNRRSFFKSIVMALTGLTVAEQVKAIPDQSDEQWLTLTTPKYRWGGEGTDV